MMAGRELDALIAEKVMGIQKTKFDPKRQFIIGMPESQQAKVDYQISCPHYSTDIAAAWLVVETLAKRGLKIGIVSNGKFFNASFEENEPIAFHSNTWCVTAPHAIGLAALRALENSAHI